ncbi:shugoshin-1-like [Neltuma alba]|uniref:shugoshin-1-like n=1 Tax=Neltuma alba TaxID=207710 RepID=UPI0010A2C9B5|nr:shugoshin-1-like [Prosopis alba]
MKGEGMAKRSIGSLMRKKLSDITNSQPQPQLPNIEENLPENLPANKDCIEQLLKERVTLLQLLAERNKIIELTGSELQRLRTNIQKLQLQNWNLAQSNTHMLAELNLGRERIKALQHDIVCRAALLKGMNFGVEGKVEARDEDNIPLSQEVEEKTARPSPRASNEGKNSSRNRRRNTRRSTGSSSTTSTRDACKKKSEDKRPSSRRHSAKVTTHEREALEDLFEIEDAKYAVTGENSGLGHQGPRSSFGRPSRKAAEKVQSYKEIPLNVKMRRLE